MPGTSKDHLETDEEYFSEQEEEIEFEGFKPMLMKTISFNAQLCAVSITKNSRQRAKSFNDCYAKQKLQKKNLN